MATLLPFGAERSPARVEALVSDADEFDIAAIESRPTSDFIDGYLAAMAATNATLAGAPANRYFYSLDWIGDMATPREAALLTAFGSDARRMALDLRPLEDWRREMATIAKAWLGRELAPVAAKALADEFVDLLEAHFGGAPVTLLHVMPIAPAGRRGFEPALGSLYDHVLIETPEGRLLLEFAIDL